MTAEPFLKPRLTGERFKGGAIPLDVLADFAVLPDLIIELAKHKYREEVGTKKVPPRFTDGITLKLVGLEEGSAIPVIALAIGTATAAQATPPPVLPYLESARAAVVFAVSAAEHNRKITDFVPEKLLGYFDRFGRNLAEGEAIELSDSPSTPDQQPARLTKETRRKLLLASSTVEEITEETSVHGQVHEFDQRARTFQLTLPDGAILSRIPVESQHYDAVLEASGGFRNGVRVRIFGVGRFDRNNRLQTITEVERVTILDPLDIPVRVDELRQLRDGWLDGKGKALRPDGLDWLIQAFDQHYVKDAPLPYLFPTPEGNILAEWAVKPWALSLDIDLTQRRGEWHALNLDSDEDGSKSLDLLAAEDWAWVADQMRTLVGGGAG